MLLKNSLILPTSTLKHATPIILFWSVIGAETNMVGRPISNFPNSFAIGTFEGIICDMNVSPSIAFLKYSCSEIFVPSLPFVVET